jgi:hypothetical protein
MHAVLKLTVYVSDSGHFVSSFNTPAPLRSLLVVEFGSYILFVLFARPLPAVDTPRYCRSNDIAEKYKDMFPLRDKKHLQNPLYGWGRC